MQSYERTMNLQLPARLCGLKLQHYLLKYLYMMYVRVIATK